jgi:hypothetical protein
MLCVYLLTIYLFVFYNYGISDGVLLVYKIVSLRGFCYGNGGVVLIECFWIIDNIVIV